MKRDASQVMRDQTPLPVPVADAFLASRIPYSASLRPRRGFSLIELLVVISILGLIAGMAVPALKDMGKSNTRISAVQQLLDDVAHGRQLAMSQHTTVYMVFLPTNFWGNANLAANPWFNALTFDQRIAFTNILDRQLSGYAFISYGRLGDQPGQHAWHYLSTWQALPEGAFICTYKFYAYRSAPTWLDIPQWRSQHPNPDLNRIWPFQTNSFPCPTEDSPPLNLPCIAFNHKGQLVANIKTAGADSLLFTTDAYLPLAQGVAPHGIDPQTRKPVPTLVNGSDIVERPPGNSTGIGYHIIHIDALTGRASQEYYKLQ